MNRRKFLIRSGQLIGVSLLSTWQMRFLQSAMATTTQAKFLICIRPGDQALSAWDSPWWHLPVNPNYCVQGPDYLSGAFRYDATAYAAGPDFKKVGARDLDAKLSYLFGTDYGWTSSDFDNFTVLKGIDFGGTGVHGQNLRPFQSGSRSPYAQDFSVLASIAANIPKMPLFYTSLSNDLISVKGQTSSTYANPVLVGNQSEWKSLTANSGTAALSDDIDAHKVAAVRALAALEANSPNTFRKSMYGSYDAAIAGASSIQAGNYSQERQFRQNWNRYLVAILQAQIVMLQDVNCRNVFQSPDAVKAHLTLQLANINPIPAMTVASSFPGNNVINYLNSTIFDSYNQIMAWRFACAEQLLRKGMSRIIDIEMPCCDAHHLSNNDGASLDFDLMMRTATNVAWREFMKDIKNIYLGSDGNVSPTATSGTSVYDNMAGLMFDQFDRTPTLIDPLGGSNHHTGASAYLFGGLFNTSRIFGAVGLGTNAPAGGFQAVAGSPLPVDFDGSSSTCGIPLDISSGGKSINFSHIFPTVCAAMGVTIPSQQINDYSAITALLKSG